MSPSVPRRLTQAERRARTRRKVLTTAAAVFAQRGYHAASLDEIGERAGLSKGSVYYNFASKQDLFLAVLEDRIGKRLEEIRGGAEASSFLERVSRDPRWGPLFFEFLVYAARDKSARPAFTGWLLDTRAALEELIAGRFEELGSPPPMPEKELAIIVSALANGLLIERMFDPEGVPPDLLGRALALMSGRA